MRRRNATAAGNSPRASSRSRCNSDMLAILSAVAGNYGLTQEACQRRSLQCPYHPPALDVRPRAIGGDDDRMIESKFAGVDAPRAIVGNALQPALVGRPARPKTGLV